MPLVRMAISHNKPDQRPSRRKINKKILERIAALREQEQKCDRSTHDGSYLSALISARIDELHGVLKELA